MFPLPPTPTNSPPPNYRLLPAWDKALEVIPTGSQTLSKLPDRFVGGVYPKMIESGIGPRVVDIDGNIFIDFIAALGPIIVGYRNRMVDRSVTKTIGENGTLFSLPHRIESALACKLRSIVPCAQQSRFFKTGSDATTAAVKVARAYTGKERVFACGYHGWHDWYTIANDKKAGIPGVLEQHISKFKYNDPQSLKDLFTDGNIAAVILEPVVLEAPRDNFLEEVVSIAHDHGALVIFDEIVTGFRFGLGGAAAYFGVSPDLATFSKAMGNGYPIAAVCGLREYMKTFEREDFFVSGTFGGDLVGISAALGTIEALEGGGTQKTRPIDRLWFHGQQLIDGFNYLAQDLNLIGVSCIGYPPRSSFSFPTVPHKALFWQECVKRGVLFGYNNFPMTCMTQNLIANVLDSCEVALRVVKEHWDNPEAAMEGKLPKEVFRLR